MIAVAREKKGRKDTASRPSVAPRGRPWRGTIVYTAAPHSQLVQRMNPGLPALQPYPFERLAALRARVASAPDRPLINLSIGEPQDPTPACIHAALIEHLADTARYPATRGLPALRAAIADWATRRFHLPVAALDPEQQVLPVNGTREALFAITQTLFDRAGSQRLVAMPNPFYQIYEGAALLAGAEPLYLPCPAERDFRPDWHAVPSSTWRR